MKLMVKRLREDAKIPQYATDGSAGMDLAMCGKPVTIEPGERALLPTGIAVAIPVGYEAQIRPRSGLALKHGIILPNSPGTIDSDYRGEIMIIVANIGAQPVTLNPGDRIAQMIISPVEKVEPVWNDDLTETDRNSGGFGSTGK
jgi:dUTP pyrophosphatase